jgi:type II secretory pathway component PulF
MTLYRYKAINENGNKISGEIDADSKQSALELLAHQGYIPETVKKKNASSSGQKVFSSLLNFARSIPISELIMFTKQFKTLLHAGVPILRIFQVLETQTENTLLKKATIQMTEAITEGSSLFKAFSVHKNIFSHLYRSMIKAGEESGALPKVLDRLIYIIEHEEKIKNDVKAAVRYPIIVICFLGIAFIVLLTLCST